MTQDERKRYIRVKVWPGMFTSERCATFSVGGENHSLVADESWFKEDLMEVYLIAPIENQVIIQLPTDTFTSGCRIRVPWDILVKA